MKLSDELDDIVEEMVRLRVRRLDLSPESHVLRVELFDTIPAPPPSETMPTDFPPAESKDPSLCQGVGCALQGGWHATPYCRAHGLSAAGVRT